MSAKQDLCNILTVSCVLGQLGGLELLLQEIQELPNDLSDDLQTLRKDLDSFKNHVNNYLMKNIENITNMLEKVTE